MNNRCPMCHEKLEMQDKQWICLCGWKKSLPKKSENNDNTDGRCCYRLGGERCPLPGDISLSIRGNPPRYCHLHWRTLDDSGLGEAALRDAQKNYTAHMAARRPWQDVLLEETMKRQQERMTRSAKQIEQKNENQNLNDEVPKK